MAVNPIQVHPVDVPMLNNQKNLLGELIDRSRAKKVISQGERDELLALYDMLCDVQVT